MLSHLWAAHTLCSAPALWRPPLYIRGTPIMPVNEARNVTDCGILCPSLDAIPFAPRIGSTSYKNRGETLSRLALDQYPLGAISWAPFRHQHPVHGRCPCRKIFVGGLNWETTEGKETMVPTYPAPLLDSPPSTPNAQPHLVAPKPRNPTRLFPLSSTPRTLP